MAARAQLPAVLLAGLALPVACHLIPCSPGPVGSCLLFGCSKSRGPAECVGHQCMCMQGYCRYPASTLHVQSRKCRAQVPDTSCSMLHPCTKGGVLSSTCVNGMCLCRSHMHVGADGECHAGWWPETALAAMNATTRAEVLALELDEETRRQESYEVAVNVATLAALVALPILVLAGGAVFLRRKLHKPQDEGAKYYEKLIDPAAAEPEAAS